MINSTVIRRKQTDRRQISKRRDCNRNERIQRQKKATACKREMQNGLVGKMQWERRMHQTYRCTVGNAFRAWMVMRGEQVFVLCRHNRVSFHCRGRFNRVAADVNLRQRWTESAVVREVTYSWVRCMLIRWMLQWKRLCSVRQVKRIRSPKRWVDYFILLIKYCRNSESFLSHRVPRWKWKILARNIRKLEILF